MTKFYETKRLIVFENKSEFDLAEEVGKFLDENTDFSLNQIHMIGSSYTQRHLYAWMTRD